MPPPAEVLPVGEHLAQALATIGWTQVEFAEILGRPPQFVSEIVSGKKEITRDSAAQISAALGTPAEHWLKLQDQYFLWQQSKNASTQSSLADVRLRAQLKNVGPMAVLVKRGFIRSTTPHEQEKEICELYGITSIDEEPKFAIAARRTDNSERLTPTQTAWTACVRSRAAAQEVAEYQPHGLAELAQSLPQRLNSADRFTDLPQQFAAVGVRLTYVESFLSSKLDGCSMMLDKSPAIGISGRGKRLDKILYTILHETAHITLGHLGSDGVIVDDQNDASHTLGQEEPADQQAADWIFPKPLPRLPGKVSYSWIQDIADSYGVHPIVVIGRYQNLGIIDWRTTLVRGAPSITDRLDCW